MISPISIARTTFLSPAILTIGDNDTGPSIACAPYDSTLYVLSFGVLPDDVDPPAAGSLTFKVQDSVDGLDWADMDGLLVTRTLADEEENSSAAILVDHSQLRGFHRIVAVPATLACVGSAVAVHIGLPQNRGSTGVDVYNVTTTHIETPLTDPGGGPLPL